VSQSSAVVGELDELQEGIGFSSELGILVEAEDVTSDEVVTWMHDFASEQVAAHPDELVRATSLPGIAEDVTGVAPVGADLGTLLGVAPDDIARTFVNADRTKANLIFPVAPLVDREALLADITAALDPPAGVEARPGGLLVVGVELIHGLEANRALMTLISLAAVAAWLLVVWRTRSALLPLVPVLLAVGLSTLTVWALGMELTPMTAVAAPLVIAVSTEFSVLIRARYYEERAAGRSPSEAVANGAVRIGRAFVASGLTLVGGFAVLAFAPMPLLRDFGILVSLNVLIALVSALVVLPPLLVWAEQHPRLTGVRTPTGGAPLEDEDNLADKEVAVR
jgi:predicted RND superfamily exporter protein